MDVNHMLAELRQEHELIEEAIFSLERLARSLGKRRGRPPLWMSAEKAVNEELESQGAAKKRPAKKRAGSKRKQPPNT